MQPIFVSLSKLVLLVRTKSAMQLKEVRADAFCMHTLYELGATIHVVAYDEKSCPALVLLENVQELAKKEGGNWRTSQSSDKISSSRMDYYFSGILPKTVY